MPLKARFSVDLEQQLVAGLDGLAKSRIVDGDEIETRVVVRHHPDGLERQDSRGLRQRLDDDDSRHHRPVREVPRESTAR